MGLVGSRAEEEEVEEEEEEFQDVMEMIETEIEPAHPASLCVSGIFLLTWGQKADNPQIWSIQLWDALEQILLWSGESENGASLTYSPAANMIFQGTWRGSSPTKVWDLNTGNLRTFLHHRRDDRNWYSVFNNSGTKMLTVESDRRKQGRNIARVWSLETGIQLFSPGCHLERPSRFTKDDSKIIGVARNVEMCLWDAETGEHILTFQDLNFTLNTLEQSGNGNRCCVLGNLQFGEWDIESGRRLFYRSIDKNIQSVCFSANEDAVVAALGNADHYLERIQCWSLTDGSTIFTAATSGSYVLEIMITSSSAALNCWSDDGESAFVSEFDIATGNQLSRKIPYEFDCGTLIGSREQAILL
jgi:WD40 repeat protein